MIWIIIGLSLVAIVAGFMVFGAYLEKKTRANAPANLEKARTLFKQGEHNASLIVLSKSFFVPSSGKYEAKDAQTALGVVNLFDELCVAMNIDLSSYTQKLKVQLEKASTAGGEVSEGLTKPFEELIEKLDSDEGIADMLFGNAMSGKGTVTDDEEHLHREKNYPEGSDEIINKVGRMLLTKKLDDALSTLESHMGTDSNDFKVYLLSTKGTIFFMKKDFQTAIKNYDECTKLDPEEPGNWRNLAEAYQHAGKKQEALDTANYTLKMKGLEKRDREAMMDVIKKLSKN